MFSKLKQYRKDLQKIKDISMAVWGRADNASLKEPLKIESEELRFLYNFIDAYCIYGEEGEGTLKREFNYYDVTKR